MLACGLALTALTPPGLSAAPRSETVLVADAGACRTGAPGVGRPDACARVGASGATTPADAVRPAAPAPAAATRTAATANVSTAILDDTGPLPELPPALLLFVVCLLIALMYRRPAD